MVAFRDNCIHSSFCSNEVVVLLLVLVLLLVVVLVLVVILVVSL